MTGSRMQRETVTLKPLIHLSGGSDFIRRNAAFRPGGEGIIRTMNWDKWRHYIRARALEVVGRHDLAMAGYREALASDPSFRRAANALAYRSALTGHSAEAIESFERVLRLDPRDATAHFNLAFVYGKAGNQRKAIEH